MKILGERFLNVVGDDKKKIIVRVYQPFQESEIIWRCNIEYLGINDDVIQKYATGVDSLSAILSSFQMIGAELRYYNNQKFKGRLFWLEPNLPIPNFGFSYPDGIKPEHDDR